MRLVQLNGPQLIVTEFKGSAMRPAEDPDPWLIDGIGALVSAMTGATSSPVIVAPPALSPAVAFVGEPVSVFPGIFNGTTPTAILRLNGVNVTSQIVNGEFTPNAPGSLTLTVEAAPLPSISVSATISPLPVEPTAPLKMGTESWAADPGTEPGSIVLNIINPPADGGLPINAYRYSINGNTPQTLDGVSTGIRTIFTEPGIEASIEIWAVNAVDDGPRSDPKVVTTIGVLVAAPSVQTAPTISGGTTVGNILTRAAGTATGAPTPTRATQWLLNGTILDGQTANSLDTTGFAADDVITTRDVWTNSEGTATGTSEAVTLGILSEPPTVTVMPAITGGTLTNGSWTLSVGSATGVPAPNANRLWRVNDDVQVGETGATFSKAGLLAGDEIRGGVRWSNVAGEVIVWSDPIVLTGQPAITGSISPNPPKAAQAFTINFNVTPDEVGSNVTLTGTGTTRTGTAPASGLLTVSATKAGYDLFAGEWEVQPEQIQATLSPSSPVDDQPVTITFSTTPESVNVTLNGSPITVTGSGTTRQVTPTATGPLHIEATRTGWLPYNETFTVVSGDTAAPVISDTAFDDATDTATFTTTEGGALHWAIHTNAAGIPTLNSNGTWTGTTIETGSATVPASGEGTLELDYTATTGDRLTYGVIDAAGNISNLITATFAPVAPGVTITNLGYLSHMKTGTDNTAHPMGNVTIPASGSGQVVVRGAIFRDANSRPDLDSITIGGVAVPIHVETLDTRACAFTASIPRSSLPAGSQPVVINVATASASRYGHVSVDFLAGAGVPGTPSSMALNGVTSAIISVDTQPNGAVLGVVAERYFTTPTSSFDWSGLTENHRNVNNISTSEYYTTEYASHLTTAAETPRAIAVTGILGGRGGAAAIFFGAA